MLRCMIAPLPIVHVSPTLKTVEEKGRVAFGSEALDFFEARKGDEDLGKLDVFVIASRTGFDRVKQMPPGVILQHAFLRGTLACVTQPDPKTGKHPDPHLRPESAHEGDGPSLIFWELAAPEKLGNPITLRAFRTAAGSAHSAALRGPTIAKIHL